MRQRLLLLIGEEGFGGTNMDRYTVGLVRRTRAARPGTAAAAGLLVMGVALTGCSRSSAPAQDASASAGAGASATASAEVSASPTSTLSAEEQQAFEEATEVVLAYRQTITDLYSGARTNLNDLNEVATGDLVDEGLTNIQQSLNEGWRRVPEGAQLAIGPVELISAQLDKKPQTVLVRACIDATDVTILSPEGEQSSGVRESLDYTLVRTGYLPDPGWAVSRVSTDSESTADRKC